MYILADYNKIKQVVLNLISNGIKYNEDNIELKINLKYYNESVLINIIDNGLGIPHNEISKIFDKFYRVGNKIHNQKKGTGLGLSIAKEIVNRHKGEIFVRSELGIGSTFTIVLPIYIES